MQGSTRIDELRQKFHENPRRYFAPLANEYRKAGDPEQAIAICRAHLAQQPGHMSGHVVYGQALYDARRTEEARVVFEKALALDPDNAIVLKQLGDISREKGDTSEARHWYSRAIEADPNDREVAAYIAELTEPLTENASAVEAASAAEALPIAERAPGEQQIPMGEPAREPEVIDIQTFDAPTTEERPGQEPEEAAVDAVDNEVAWRKTPPHEESPFVTRTMAELYASQGYRQAAIDVYRQLALQHPDDREIFDRIAALEKDEGSDAVAAAPSVESEPAEVADVPATPSEQATETRAPELLPFEPMINDMPMESGSGKFSDLDTETPFPPSNEDLNLDVAAEVPSRPSEHFTETELGTGDTWDSDSWGAGFDTDEDPNLDFDSPDVPSPETPAPVEDVAPVEEAVRAEEPARAEETPPMQPIAMEQVAEVESSPEPEPEPVAVVEPEAHAEPEPVRAAEPEPELEPIREPESEPEPIAQLEEASAPQDAAAAEESLDVAGTVTTEEFESAPDDSAVVAYSPQLPEEEDLPHYVPKGPTVREFFATLGAFRPSAKPGSSITAHGAIPPEASSPDYPLASDAFANLFSDNQVSDEDSRAAFALSGALGAPAPTSAAITAPSEPQPPAPAASPASTQESEEDIRRFREWLDGLAES